MPPRDSLLVTWNQGRQAWRSGGLTTSRHVTTKFVAVICGHRFAMRTAGEISPTTTWHSHSRVTSSFLMQMDALVRLVRLSRQHLSAQSQANLEPLGIIGPTRDGWSMCNFRKHRSQYAPGITSIRFNHYCLQFIHPYKPMATAIKAFTLPQFQMRLESFLLDCFGWRQILFLLHLSPRSRFRMKACSPTCTKYRGQSKFRKHSDSNSPKLESGKACFEIR